MDQGYKVLFEACEKVDSILNHELVEMVIKTHSCYTVPPATVFLIYNTSDNKVGMKDNLTKYKMKCFW